jgi:Septum formation
MAAPAGVSSGSAPEPVDPEPPVTEPPAPGPADLGVADLGAADLGAADLEPPGPTPSEAAIADLEPEPSADEPARKARSVGWVITVGVVTLLVVLAATAGVLAVTTHGFRPKTVVTYRPAAVYGLRAGECINSSPNGLSFTRLSCAAPHQAEVFATFSLTGSSWPGSAAVQQQASDGCTSRLASYLNPQLLNAGLVQQFVYPNRDAWQAGVRTVVCEVSSTAGPLSGSVRGSG